MSISAATFASTTLLKIRGGATKLKVRRKTKKLGVSLMMTSFVKSIFDPTFGLDDFDDDSSTTVKKSKLKKSGKKQKLGSGGGEAHGSMFTGSVGAVCGPNGCV